MAKSTTPENGAEVSAQPEEGSRSKVSRVRRYVPGIVFALLIIGLVAGIGSGTLCSVGYESIAAVCPLGALESLFGAGAFVARAVIILVVAAAVVLLVGKAFCSWVCPIPPLDRFLSGKKRREADKAARIEAAHHVSGRLAACAGCAGCGEKKPGETPLAPPMAPTSDGSRRWTGATWCSAARLCRRRSADSPCSASSARWASPSPRPSLSTASSGSTSPPWTSSCSPSSS